MTSAFTSKGKSGVAANRHTEDWRDLIHQEKATHLGLDKFEMLMKKGIRWYMKVNWGNGRESFKMREIAFYKVRE